MYLEGLNEDIQKENESMQTELEEKDRTIRDLKSVVHRLQREQLQSKINAQYLHDKIEKGQVEYQYTVQQLQNKLRKLSCKKCKENNLP